MQFIFPSFLWALLLLAIPILIHLFYFRRFKKVYFTNVKFLKEVKDETSNRSRIRNLLVLLSRLAALACLIFAFAQPFIANKEIVQNQDNYISLFIDNSFSMKALSEDVPLLDKAKSTARNIVEAFAESDHFQVVTHNLTGKQQRWLNKEDALLVIDEILATPEVNLLSTVINRQQTLMETAEGNKSIYMLSDFQSNITNLPASIDTNLSVKLMPFQSIQENNLSIDSVWTVSPVPLKNQNNSVVVRIKNNGNEDKDDVRLFVNENGQTKPVGAFNIKANSEIIDTIELVFINDGWQDVEIKIEDYPIQFDDNYKIALKINDEVNIMSINESGNNKFLTALMEGLPNFNLTNQPASSIQYNEFDEQDLIILNDMNNVGSGLATELENHVLNGGKVLIFPGRNISKDSYNQLFGKLAVNNINDFDETEREVFKINTNEFIFSNVYERVDRNVKLPVTNGNYSLSNFSSRGAENLLNYRDGSPFIQKYTKGKGIVYLCAAPLAEEYSDLVKIAEVFVPMVYKMALSSAQNKPIAYTIGSDNLAETANVSIGNESIFKIKGEEEFIPGQSKVGRRTIIDFNDMISKDGFYDLTINDSIVDRFAFNFDRKESLLEFSTNAELKNRYSENYEIFENFLKADVGQLVQDKDKGRSLWRTFLILALIFLGIETLLLRFWKV